MAFRPARRGGPPRSRAHTLCQQGLAGRQPAARQDQSPPPRAAWVSPRSRRSKSACAPTFPAGAVRRHRPRPRAGATGGGRSASSGPRSPGPRRGHGGVRRGASRPRAEPGEEPGQSTPRPLPARSPPAPIARAQRLVAGVMPGPCAGPRWPPPHAGGPGAFAASVFVGAGAALLVAAAGGFGWLLLGLGAIGWLGAIGQPGTALILCVAALAPLCRCSCRRGPGSGRRLPLARPRPREPRGHRAGGGGAARRAVVVARSARRALLLVARARRAAQRPAPAARRARRGGDVAGPRAGRGRSPAPSSTRSCRSPPTAGSRPPRCGRSPRWCCPGSYAVPISSSARSGRVSGREP